MATTVQKSYEAEVFGKDLYWPEKNEMFDMLQINIYEYVPIARSNVGTTTEFTNVSNIQNVNPTSTLGTNPNTQGNKKSLAKVLLPVPNDINYVDQLSWSSENLGILGKMLPALAQGAISDSAGVGNMISKLAGAGTPEFILNAIKNIPGAPSPESLTQGIGGKVLNPYVEQIFKGIGMRDFTFTWKLVPRNANEQSRIHNIIRTLRYYSLPNYNGSGVIDNVDQSVSTNKLTDRWLTVPNIFNLTWKQAGVNTAIQSLPRIKPCVLKSVQVNYTPDNVWATHINTSSKGLSGPAPVAYELSLVFTETEIITANDVKAQGGGY